MGWCLVFAAVLVCASVAPVLAESPPETQPEVVLPPAPEDFDPTKLPGGDDVAAAIDEAAEEEAKREAWLTSPVAVEEREASLVAYSGLTSVDAAALLSSTFADELAQLNSDPARFLSGAQLLSSSEETAATVKDEGQRLVMDAGNVPVRTVNEEGRLAKVDLSLEVKPWGWETKNALVDVRIPASPDQPVEVGEKGVSIKLLGADAERDARPFGDVNVLATEVLPDTDMLVSPLSTGVEIFNQLRSERSPETLRYRIAMPAGAVLRADGAGGAEVLSDGELMGRVPAPLAVDAQGTDVPVSLQVEGDTLVLGVAHRSGDFAMPILVDPQWFETETILENNWNWIYGENHNALDMGVWAFNKNVAGMHGSTYCIYYCFGQPSNVRGLFVSGQSGTYWPNQFAQWSYSTPNANSFIWSASLGPYLRWNHGCNTIQYPQPHDYFGLWNPQGWAVVTTNSTNHPAGSMTVQGAAQAAIFGLGSGGGAVFSIPCWRDIYAAGAHVWMSDWGHPWLHGAPTGIPSAWVSNETPFTIKAVAKDDGLGIKNVYISQQDGPMVYDIPQQNQCAGTRRSPCQTTHNASFDNLHGGEFFEGERGMSLNAHDALGRSTANHPFTLRVDNTPPEMTLKGQFAEATNEVGSAEVPAGKGDQLSLPVYKLEIETKDGNKNNPLSKRSGVNDIEIYLDGPETETVSWVEQPVPWEPQPCDGPDYSCSMNKTYQVQLSKLTTSGKYVLKVEAVDQVGKRLKRELEFEYFPATGMKDEYVMHYFPLPDGSGNEADEMHPDRPELAVNVMNGNLVYREQDIEIEGPGVDLEVERYYNSMLPENEDTEWGDGWTLAQTPDLDPIKTGGSPIPNEAEILDSSGAIEEEVGLPTQAGAEQFDPALQATLTKKADGGYELTDETGESATSVAFDETGRTEALLSEGHARVDYSYEGGELAEIEVRDPATFAADPAELEIPEPELITESTYDSAFGSNGSGDGQLKFPADVAVDAQGNLWVVDKSNNRVQKFDSSGKYLAKFGSLGSGDGQFNRPTAITMAANGDVLVTDAGNSRVQRFSAAGAFISKFGSKGSGNGQFNGSGPEGIAIDSAGNVWVSDTYAGRLQKFSAAGAFLQAVGTKGSGSGQLGRPTGIDIAPNGDVWVADWQNNRVSVFSSAGGFVSSFGSGGSGDGQFNRPDEIEIDKLGNVWVGDQSNNRVQRFDLAGQFKEKFGAVGSGPGRFNFTDPLGIAADSKGRLWVADVANHRIQRWLVPVERPAFVRNFGSPGSGDGQLSAPADVGVLPGGDLLVVDKANHRIQRFDESGKYLGKFGAFGPGNGQFSRPTAIAVDRDGNVLVVDANNHRVQKFSPDGQFMTKFGSVGMGNGELGTPEGIATDHLGNIWVADSGNGRIQKFSEDGEFLAVIGSKGSAPGQLGRPIGIDVDAEGRLWVGDFQNHRISIFESDGDFVSQFGSLGTGPGQFNGPSGVEIDARDNVWVADQVNGRVQRFDMEGQYVGQFGSPGTSEGQFSFPTLNTPVGITSDLGGKIWITDVNSHRIQRWMLGHYAAAEPEPLDLSDGDPSVEVETSGGLVASVAGNAAGEHTYEHDGDFLTSHDGPEGETVYEKDPSTGLLSKVTLPNGTWAKVKYFADKRVESVEVKLAGEPSSKTTQFHYEDGPPRRSKVTPPGEPQITYDIAGDGSVLKWWYKASPPEILKLVGSLGKDKNGTEVPEGDLFLDVEADSPHGVSSIQIIANGDQLVSEKICKQDPDQETECVREKDIWPTDTASLTPGVLHIEVIVANELGATASERWWVTIPHTAPPVPGAPVPPKFSEILKFREDYGLEVVFPVASEQELVERIYGLRNAWYSPNTPAGEVARASASRWGVPLRPEDVAELEYRQRYLDQANTLIPAWAAVNAPGNYAGYWMDHRSGGIIRVGFTANQASSVAQLNETGGLIAPDRVAPFAYQPTRTLATLEASQGTVSEAVTAPPFPPGIVSIGVDVPTNSVELGTTEVAQTEVYAAQAFGGTAGVVIQAEQPSEELAGRYKGGVPFLAATRIRNMSNECAAGFGAWSKIGEKANGEPLRQRFVLTAGHCFPFAPQNAASIVSRMRNKTDTGVEIGKVMRQGFLEDRNKVDTDAEAVLLEHGDAAPSWVYECCGGNASMKVTGVTFPKIGEEVCQSSHFVNRISCGPVTNVSDFDRFGKPSKPNWLSGWHWVVRAAVEGGGGDSGGPVWKRATGEAVGLVLGGGEKGLAITPFMRPPGAPAGQIAGIFSDPHLSPPARPLRVQVAK